MKKKWIELFIHIIFWLSTAWLISSGFSIQSHEIESTNGVETITIIRNSGLIYQLLLCIIVSAVIFYFNIRLIYTLNQSKATKNRFWYSALTLTIALLIVYIVTNLHLFQNAPPLPQPVAMGIVTFYFAISVAYGLTKLLLHKNQREQQLIIDKKQAEVTLLRNQLQPHFLFNAINNLLSMVNPDKNPKLVDSFEQLSLLLRYVIEETRAEKVSIAKEIGFLKNYIQLQLLRFTEGEITLQFDEHGQFDRQKIESGLFIAFVENAFKYGTEPEKKASIEIGFDLSKPDSVHFKIRNKVLMKNTSRVGTGIETTRKRLDLIYPNAYELSISNIEYFVVKLNIKTT